MVAAENDALPKGKVGGVADVVRDAPQALAALGCQVDVVIPCYGYVSGLPQAKWLAELHVPYAGQLETVSLYQYLANGHDEPVQQFVLHHPLFAAGGQGQIYCNDGDGRPFATDACKFALFSAAVAEALVHGLLPWPDVLHLHDWHAAFVAILRQFEPRYQPLASLHTVFSIHNLALQGIRPFSGDSSALETWYPFLRYDGSLICDPSYQHCVNPMRAGIVLADKVHVVSPSYAEEVLCHSQPEQGFFGGERLEYDLLAVQQRGGLIGIINGCNYAEPTAASDPVASAVNWSTLFTQIQSALALWIGQQPQLRSVDFLAWQRALQWAQQPAPGFLMTSVGRLTDQKALLLRQAIGQGLTALDGICQQLGPDRRLIMLGSGDRYLEQVCMQVMSRQENLLFLNGFSANLSDSLYQLGDLFLMPSSFEPCGISQMLAMRAGQLCLVHDIGGLKDTVNDGVDGFSFAGNNLAEQINGLQQKLADALTLFSEQPEHWQTMKNNAQAKRFLWQRSAQAYLEKLYR